ncbi:MAG: DUF2752 domain-containing protein [Muribaculaceae bacterium]|nr:DUF2752 domain-containing protein [Muribaculaceae bacterium]
MKKELSRAVVVATVAAIVVAIVVLYSVVDPETAWMPKCPVKMLTGYDCPGCGSQRALHALLHGDLSAAWNFNPALFVSAPIIFILLFAATFNRRYPRLYRATLHPAVPITILVATVLWTVFRNMH